MDWHARFTQQAGWTESLRRYLFERAGLAAGQRLLEVGCGTGAVLSSSIFRDCHLHGLDLDNEFLQQARQNLAAAPRDIGYTQIPPDPLTPNWPTGKTTALVQGDAHALPYPDASFDLAFCHFLLLWVSDPARVLGEMRRVTRPGGWVLALAEPDYGGRVDYPDELVPLGALQEAALRRQGAETRLGRRLAGLFHAARLAEIETGVLGGEWRGSPTEAERAQEWEVLQADLGATIAPAELARLRRLDQQAWACGERTLFVPTFYAMGKKDSWQTDQR
jgi:SAM-dependent methyltransferase